MAYNRLKGKIIEVFGSLGTFAEAMHMSRSTLSIKMNNKSEWTQKEILEACNLLAIPIEDLHLYFFEAEVA